MKRFADFFNGDKVQFRRLGQANGQRFPERAIEYRIAGGIRKIPDQNGIRFRKFRAALRIPVESRAHQGDQHSDDHELGPHERWPL